MKARKTKDRTPKKDYFQMRYDDAVANKDTQKISYYGTRLAELNGILKLNPLLEYVNNELSKLDRSIVATPSEDYLEQFVKANHGSGDYLLMQMSKNYGYKIALLNMQEMLVTNINK